MSNKLVPIIVGAAQFSQAKDVPQPLDPVRLMGKTCELALNDAEAASLRDHIDKVCMSNIVSWQYRDAPGLLCEILGLKSARKAYPFLGGNMPQKYVNGAAREITSGECRAVLITGGEAHYALRRGITSEIDLDWPERQEPDSFDGGNLLSSSDFENHYGLLMPIGIYSMFETALRKVSGRSWEEHNRYLGAILEPYSQAAAQNPYAWTRKAYTAEEIITPIPENRYICYPYTIRMVANIQVDQSAAVVMTSEKVAEELGIDRSLWVYPMGGADIENIYYTTQRPDLYSSPATREGMRLALEQAGLSLKDIDLFDIYSCFTSMIQIFLKEMGLAADDPRGLSVTGGLPYFGAPVNNYSLHAIVTMVARIRENRSFKALVVAMGGMNTKPSFGVYGSEPPACPWGERDDTAIQQEILSKGLPVPAERAAGELMVDGYAIHYGRDGRPEMGTVIGRLEDGCRSLARLDADTEALDEIKEGRLVGRVGVVRFNDESGRNQLSLTL